jgi:hypothetical protein
MWIAPDRWSLQRWELSLHEPAAKSFLPDVVTKSRVQREVVNRGGGSAHPKLPPYLRGLSFRISRNQSPAARPKTFRWPGEARLTSATRLHWPRHEQVAMDTSDLVPSALPGP